MHSHHPLTCSFLLLGTYIYSYILRSGITFSESFIAAACTRLTPIILVTPNSQIHSSFLIPSQSFTFAYSTLLTLFTTDSYCFSSFLYYVCTPFIVIYDVTKLPQELSGINFLSPNFQPFPQFLFL